MPEIYWVRDIEPVRLAIMPRPRGGDELRDHISGWRRAGLESVASLLEPHEIEDLALAEERVLCERSGIEFLSFPIPDGGVPASAQKAADLVATLVSRLRSGVGVGVHCHAGIGRSGLVSGCVLLQLGVPFDEVFPILTRARGFPVPGTLAQVEWVRVFPHEATAP